MPAPACQIGNPERAPDAIGVATAIWTWVQWSLLPKSAYVGIGDG
jgi:hypothetical protein